MHLRTSENVTNILNTYGLTIVPINSKKHRNKSKRICLVVVCPLLLVILLFTALFFFDKNPKHYSRIVNKKPPIKSQDENERSEEDYGKAGTGYLRLPETNRPSYYKLELTPYLDSEHDWRLEGSVLIIFDCLHPTSRITFHSVNQTIYNISVQSLTEQGTPEIGDKISVLDSSPETHRHFYNIKLNKMLKLGGQYQIQINYTTKINEEFNGFYRSSYFDSNVNDIRYAGITQFEPIYARKAFPCFDEPQLKAIFEISIARPKHMKAISNGRLLKTEPHLENENWVWDHFEPTLPMSTYLVAFVVSEFSYQETHFLTKENANKTFRVWSRPDVISETNYVFEIGPKLLSYFEEYFDVEYPIEKMDIVAVPDFDSGGMENWGLIIFKEAEMLYNPHKTSNAVKNIIASTISHEISHQWFGDLVTPKWWSDIWLNEGFASYFEYVGVNYVESNWNKMELLVIDELEDVMSTDSLDFTRPISIPVEDPDDIEELFDGISYAKGASIIGMLNHFLTPKTFRNGLRRYLNKWKYNNTIPTNLWHAFSEQAHEDKTLVSDITVGDIMDTWTLQRGFPLISVLRNYEMQTAEFTQNKYKLNNRNRRNNSAKWWIPISYATNKFNSNFTNSAPKFWMSPNDKTVEIKIESETYDWLIVNVNSTGYFRVNYDMRNWQLILNQLKTEPTAISVLNRAQIMDDSMNLARSLTLPYAFVFSLVEYLRKMELEFSPWEAYLNNLQHISNMLSLTPAYTYFQSYVRRLIEFEYNKVEFRNSSNHSFLGTLHQQAMVLWACSSNHDDCIRRGKDYYTNWNKLDLDGYTGCPIPANFRKPMYCSIVENGGSDEWNFLWKKYNDSNSSTDTKALIQGLACSTDSSKLSKMLDMASDGDDGFRQQDATLVFKEVAINPIGTDIVFNYLEANWTLIQDYLSDADIVITVLGDQYNTPEQLRRLLLFKTNFGSELGTSQRAFYQTVEKVKCNIDWMSSNYQSIYNLLKTYISMH